jgi:hypothetical protein
MKVHVVEKAQTRYIEGIDGETLLANEQDVLELLGLCLEHDADRILLYPQSFPETFFDLKSGQAGMILQKLMNYHVKAAAIVSPDFIRGRFKDFVTETNRGNHFRVFHNRDEAEKWLTSV